jgi:hypothetical protein
MTDVKPLFDQYGVIHEANKILPDDDHKIALVEALAELEDNECHRTHNYPITKLHKVVGVKQPIYRAYIKKMSGWRLHLQFNSEVNQLHLKDVVEGSLHDDVIHVIKVKNYRYV